MTIRARMLGLLGVLAAVVGLGLGLAGPAAAHDFPISSSPANGATLTTDPGRVTFTFDLPVENVDPAIAVVGPDGKSYQTNAATVSGNSVTSSMSLGPAGAYLASYRIVSADGHPVAGTIRFTFTGTGSGVGAGETSLSDLPPGSVAAADPGGAGSAASAVPTDASQTTGLPSWIWIGLAIAAVIVAAAAALMIRKPKR